MMYLANSWERLRDDQDVIESLMAAFDIDEKQAMLHLNMAKEEYGPVGSTVKEMISEGFKVTDEMVDKVIKQLKIDASDSYKKELKMGIKVEQEHGPDRGEDTNITDDDLIMTAKIAISHLKELPDYYTRLDKMEKEGKAALKK